MTDRLDDRIRELYSELAEAAPPLPPLPARESARPWQYRRLVLAGGLAVAVLVVGAGIGMLSLLKTSSDDSAALPSPDVPGTAAQGTAAPPATDVTGGFAAEDPGEQGRPRPVERILLMAALNTECAEASEVLSATLPAALVTQEDYRTAFTLIFDRLEELKLIVEAANPDSDDELTSLGDAIATAQGNVILGGDEPVTGGYPVSEITDLASTLTGFGAVECGGLPDSLP